MKQSDLTTMLAELVGIRSVNPLGRGSNPASSPDVLAWLERFFAGHAIRCERQPVGSREFNLVATVPGPETGPVLLFDAHTDTVPADDWSDRAFNPRVQSGRLYGRGSCDTKGCMVAMISAMSHFHALPLEQRPATVIFVATADEEYGRTGVSAFLQGRPQIDYAIVGEPTSLVPVIACKGAARWDMAVMGRSAHSSTPRKGLNAIVRMARLVQVLEEYEQAILSAKRHPLVDPATVTVSLIRGGTAVNVVPAECHITVDLRTMPDEKPQDAMDELQRYLKARLNFDVLHENVQLWGGADLPPSHPLVKQTLEACASAGMAGLSPLGANYGCHASDYAGAGIPAVVLGPGDIAYAHAIDEYIELDSLAVATDVYYHLMTTPIARRRGDEMTA